MHIRPLITVLACLLCASPASAVTWPSSSPRGVVYDSSAAIALLQAELGEDGWVQQQPMTRIFDVSRQAWKVTTRTATASTPSIRGLTGVQMADLLQSRITRSAGKLVFIDEIDDRATLTFGPQLAEAMTILSQRQTPAGGTYAERVHIYLGPPRVLLADPAAPMWDALALSGGIWLEAYQATRNWEEAEWAVWPPRVRAILAGRGVPDSRLRLLFIGAGDWQMARYACAWRDPGVGAYRTGGEMPAFIAGWRATFRDGAYPCQEPPAPMESQRADLAALISASGGVSLTGGQVIPTRLWAGLPGSICVTGLRPIYGPQTVLYATGGGAAATEAVRAGVPTCVPVRATRPDRLTLRLVAPEGRMWETGVMWGVDFGPLTPAVIARPADPRLSAPVNADPAAASILTIRPVETAATLRLSRRGDGWVRAQGRDPRIWAAVAIRVMAKNRAPVPRSTVLLKSQGPWRARVTTDAVGNGLAWVRRATVRRVMGTVRGHVDIAARVAIPRPPAA